MDSFSYTLTFNELLARSAPLVSTDSDGENPFFSGTCFRAAFAGRTYVITARHCIRNSDSSINLETTRIECATTEQAYLPLKTWHLFDTRLPEDTDHSDIAIFEVDLERMNEEEKTVIPTVDVMAYPLPNDFQVGYRLVVEGFPYPLGDMEYDQRRWVRRSEKLEARYDGPTENELGTSKLTFCEAREAEDLNGLSGAPVFAFKKPTPTTFVVGFAGMIIRARYFIDADIINQALKKISAHEFPKTSLIDSRSDR